MSSTVPKASRSTPRRSADVQRLYEEHASFVRDLARHLLGPGRDTDDVTQEVFVVAWRKRDEFLAGSERAWLCRVTVRVCQHELRRGRLWRFWGMDSALHVPATDNPEVSAETREAFAHVDAALQAMPERRRTVLVLYEIHGFSGQEIAELLGCPLKTVHTRLFHARREFLSRLGPEILERWSSARRTS